MRENSIHVGNSLPIPSVLMPHSEQDSGILVDINYPHLLHVQYFSFQALEEAYTLAEYISRFLPKKFSKKVELGLKEIFFNAIEHGNLGIGFEEKAQLKKSKRWLHEVRKRMAQCQDKKVEVILDVTPAFVSIKVKDEGEGFDWRQLDEPPTANNHYALHGRGLILARHLCFDRLEFSEKGNEVCCLVYLTNVPSFTLTQQSF